MDTGTLRGIIIILLIIAFVGLTLWAYSRRRKPDFDEAANLPFADDDEASTRDAPTSSRQDGARHPDSRNDKGDTNA